MRNALLLCLLVFIVGDFRYFPGIGEIHQVVYPLFFLYAIYVASLLLLQWRRLDGFDIYLLLLILIVPVYEAYAAQNEFGQPMIYGILHERGLASLAGVILLKDLYVRGRVTMAQIGDALVKLAWFSSIIYVLLSLFVPPALFANRIGFVTVFHGQVIYAPQIHFIAFGVLYYAMLAIRTGRAVNYLYATLIYTGGLGVRGGRGLTVILAVTYAISYIAIRGWRSFAIKLPVFALSVGLALGVLALVAPQFLAQRGSEFSDAFTVLLTGSEVADDSANARIAESLFALQGIRKHPVLGNGSLSAQWRDGPNAVFGEWFSPGDVGLLGSLWQYGAAMALFFSFQYFFTVRALRRSQRFFANPKEQILVASFKAFLLFFFLISIVSAQFFYDIQLNVLFTVLLPKAAAGKPYSAVQYRTGSRTRREACAF